MAPWVSNHKEGIQCSSLSQSCKSWKDFTLNQLLSAFAEVCWRTFKIRFFGDGFWWQGNLLSFEIALLGWGRILSSCSRVQKDNWIQTEFTIRVELNWATIRSGQNFPLVQSGTVKFGQNFAKLRLVLDLLVNTQAGLGLESFWDTTGSKLLLGQTFGWVETFKLWWNFADASKQNSVGYSWDLALVWSDADIIYSQVRMKVSVGCSCFWQKCGQNVVPDLLTNSQVKIQSCWVIVGRKNCVRISVRITFCWVTIRMKVAGPDV